MTATYTATYTVVDIESVLRKFKTGLTMIAESTRAMDAQVAQDIAADLLTLSKGGYLKNADITLIHDNAEIRAAQYSVTEQGGDLTAGRPGGVTWPCLSGAWLRVVIWYTPAWYALTDQTRRGIQQGLKRPWTTNYDDLSHAALQASGGRNFTSNAYGMARKDFSR